MLDESEWAEIRPYLLRSLEPNKLQPALDIYERQTGYCETNINAIWHHRIALYGPPCKKCGKPLRTPKAKLCAACGASLYE